MTDDELLRYSRHLLLPEIGVEGQQRLLAAHALVVGVGGLGSPAAMYLAAAGVGTLTLCDADAVDLTNLQRQIAHRTAAVGRPKVDSARATLDALNPGITVQAIAERLAGDALAARVAEADVVLDCSDNFATRDALNRACRASRTPLVSGAAIGFEGQVAVFDARDAQAPCYACLFPEGGGEDARRCAESGVFAPLTGVIGALQAGEALKLLSGMGSGLSGRLLRVDLRGPRLRTAALTRDPACPVCAKNTAA